MHKMVQLIRVYLIVLLFFIINYGYNYILIFVINLVILIVAIVHKVDFFIII